MSKNSKRFVVRYARTASRTYVVVDTANKTETPAPRELDFMQLMKMVARMNEEAR